MSRILYELVGADPEIRFSPHCWKARMALAHKGLETETRPWRFVDKTDLAFSGQDKVPVLVDGEQVIADSWQIACYLERRYPDAPSLFSPAQADEVSIGNAMPLVQLINAWVDTQLIPTALPLFLMDIHAYLDEPSQAYFRQSRERRFGKALEAVGRHRDEHFERLAQVLTPIRLILQQRPFLAGPKPGYADYAVFGTFMWCRAVSDVALVATDSPIHAWQERLLDAFDGLARRAKRAMATGQR
ncbi:MAG: glutathione S-transferase family protein [Lautropia sp.]|nr:glutathione S-transferase family protein [Lautropia sp.]